jgi:hypothetical protein
VKRSAGTDGTPDKVYTPVHVRSTLERLGLEGPRQEVVQRSIKVGGQEQDRAFHGSELADAGPNLGATEALAMQAKEGKPKGRGSDVKSDVSAAGAEKGTTLQGACGSRAARRSERSKGSARDLASPHPIMRAEGGGFMATATFNSLEFSV